MAFRGWIFRTDAAPSGEKGHEEPTERDVPGVDFVREETRNRMGAMLVYRIYRAPDAATARVFLENNRVTRRLHYLVVETPDGTFCRDVGGLFEELR